MSLTDLREKQARLVAEARERLDQINANTDESRSKELEAQHDEAMKAYDDVRAKIEREERIAKMEAELNAPDPRRPREDGEARKGDGEKTAEQRHSEAFVAYLRGGMSELTTEQRQILRDNRDPELRAAAVAPNTAGGYLVPMGFAAELVKSMKMWGPMLDPGVTRELVTSAGNTIPFPTTNDTANTGALVAENTDVSTSTDITFGQKTLNAYKYTTRVLKVSSELFQDSALDIEAIVRDLMAERLGRIVNTDLTTGTGSSQPDGIVTAAGAGATAAAATSIVFDDLINLMHAVDPAYRSAPSVRWMFNDTTLKALRKLKDGDGNYIWQDASVAGTVPATILGKPYVINQAVADIATTAKSVVFGDLSKYIVRRVRDFSLRSLSERYAEYDQTGFVGFGRYDGNLLDTGAVKVLAHP